MSKPSLKLSTIIITKNEEDNIERVVTSAAFSDEVIVVDAESSDETAAIAQRLGARVFVRPWPGYGPQKNFGAAKAEGEWLLFLDADEEVPPALAREIRATIESPAKDFYWFKIINLFLGRPLKHLAGHNPRLFRKNVGSWTGYHVHEQVQTNAGVVIQLGDNHSAVLKHTLRHYSHDSIGAYLKKMAEYTALDAQQMAKHDQHRSGRPVEPNWLLPPRLASRQLVKMLVYKKGLLDGYAGVIWSALSAYYEWVMAKKYIRLKSGRRSAHEPVLR